MPREKRAATESAATDAVANTPAESAATLTPEVTVATVEPELLANPAAIAPDAADATPVLTSAAIDAARANIAQIETALGVLGESNPAAAALNDALTLALGTLALALDNAKLDAERQSEIDAANAAASVANLSPDILSAMLAAIDAKYAPAPPPAPEATEPEVTAEPTRRGASDRSLALNAAAASDTAMQARAADAVAGFDSDSPALACNVMRKPNTRFSGMVALAPSSSGVANYADYDALTRAIRAYLVNVKRWPTSPNDGQSVPEAKWLASRGRYVLGGGVKSALACFNSGAEIAQYADGRFRFAYRGQSGVRFLRTDNAAWQAFVGGASPAPVTPPVSTPDAPSTPPAPRVPTPPTVQANPASGLLASTARCQHCNARNIVGQSECNACGAGDWLDA